MKKLILSFAAVCALGAGYLAVDRPAAESTSKVAPAAAQEPEVFTAITGVPCKAPKFCCWRLPNGNCFSHAECVSSGQFCP